MLTSERIAEIQSRSRADYACLDAPGFRDSLAARRDVAALLEDRAEMVAEIERLQAVAEAAEELRRLCRTDNYEWDGPEIREAVMAVFAALAALEARDADE